jgi:hypothetical protein
MMVDPDGQKLQVKPQMERLSRSSWNLGGGPMMSRCVAGLIVHGGCDSLAGLGVERGAQGR